MANEKEFDIFGTKSIDVNTHQRETKKKESNIYSPKAKDAADGVYEAKVRFLYNPANPQDSIIHKVVYYLEDKDKKGHYFDSPQSVGDWNSCVAGQLWKKLSKSESALDRKNAEKLNKRDVYYSLVYIIDDKVNPSLNGKVMIFKYGIKIKAKLDKYLNPKPGKKKIDIFNFFNGRNFDLNITRQGNFNEYSDAEFEEDNTAIVIDGKEVTADDKGRAALQKLMTGAPNLEEFRYKPLTDEERAKLNEILNLYRNPADHVDAIVNDKPKTSSSKKVQVDSDDEEAETETESKPAAKAKSAQKAEAAKGSDDENLDDFLDNLGI